MTLRGPLAAKATRLGTAIASFPIVGAAAVDGGLLAVVSRNINPAQVALLDLDARRAVAVIPIPTGDGAWAIAAAPGALWLGMFGARRRANLYRLDLATRQLRTAAAIDAVHIWDLAVAADGMVYGVSDGPAGLFSFNPSTWLAVDLQAVQTGRELARSVAVVGGAVVVGGRRDQRAMLRAVDRRTRAARSILPPALADHGIVYALHVRGEMLAVGTRGPGERNPAVALLDVARLDAGRAPVRLGLAVAEGESVVETLFVEGGGAWATVRPSGRLVRAGPTNPRTRTIARPVPLAEQRRVTRVRGALVGASGDGSVWRLADDHSVEAVIDLVGDGLVQGGPEIVQSLAAANGRVWAGGTFGVARRDPGAELVRTAVPGEPKAMVEVAGVLHLALYPIGEVWALQPGSKPRRLAALPAGENRPLALVHVASRDVLLVGTAADRAGGGGLHVVERRSGRLRSVRNPIDGRQRVSRIAMAGADLALLGGTSDGALVAWDLSAGDGAGRQAWRIDAPAPGGGAVAGLAVDGTRAHLLTTLGWHAVVDLVARRVIYRTRIGDSGGALHVVAGAVWGVDADRLLRFHPITAAAEVQLQGLAPRHWSHPTFVVDGSTLFVLHRTDVLRITVG